MKDKFNAESLMLHHRVSSTDANPLSTPIYQNSAFSDDSTYFYTRKSNPNSLELEQTLSILEEGKQTITTTTGMSALNLCLQLLKPGDHLVVNKLSYGCSLKLFQRHCVQNGIQLSIIDLSSKEGLAQITDRVSMVIFETPTNPFLKSISIREVSEHVKRRNDRALIVVDNTWATPLFQKPLQHGADISVSSATKFISGHSDVMGGFVSTNNDDLAERLRETRFYTGAILDPNSAWLLRRSLHTFPLRMREHVRTTREICTYLYTRKEIETVYFPETGKDQLIDYGGIVFVQLKEQYQNYYNDLKNHLHLFNTGTGMACVNSMIAQPWSGSHASLSDQEKREMGLNPGLIRLCFGLETLDDLTADLGQAFDRMSQRHLEEITAEEELSEFATYE